MATGTIKHQAATITSISGTGASGVTTSGKIVYDPNTSTVRLYCIARSSNNIGTGTTLAIIPEGYRPSAEQDVYCMMGFASGSPAAYYGVVKTNGVVNQSLTSSAREVLLVGEWKI